MLERGTGGALEATGIGIELAEANHRLEIGGGSLELVPVEDGTVGEGCSLPAGPLRLPNLGGGDRAADGPDGAP